MNDKSSLETHSGADTGEGGAGPSHPLTDSDFRITPQYHLNERKPGAKQEKYLS